MRAIYTSPSSSSNARASASVIWAAFSRMTLRSASCWLFVHSPLRWLLQGRPRLLAGGAQSVLPHSPHAAGPLAVFACAASVGPGVWRFMSWCYPPVAFAGGATPDQGAIVSKFTQTARSVSHSHCPVLWRWRFLLILTLAKMGQSQCFHAFLRPSNSPDRESSGWPALQSLRWRR